MPWALGRRRHGALPVHRPDLPQQASPAVSRRLCSTLGSPGMRRISLLIGKLFLAYVVAGAVLVMYVRRSDLGGHADVPFSGFPELLIWSPFAPALIVSEFAEHRIDGVVSLIVFAVVFSLVGWLLLRRRGRPTQ